MPNKRAEERNGEYFVNDCGEWNTTGVIHEVDLNGNAGVHHPIPTAEESFSFKIDPIPTAEESFSFKIDLPRCSSRRRFVKLLMADGTSRNDAEAAARIVQNCGYSYRYGLFWWRVAGRISLPTIFGNLSACGGVLFAK